MGIEYFFISLLAIHFLLILYRILEPEISHKKTKKYPGDNNRFTFLIIAIIAVTTISLSWIFTEMLKTYIKDTNYQSESSLLKEIGSALSSDLIAIDNTVKTMAGSPGIKAALLENSEWNLKQANAILDRYNMENQTSVCYLLDQSGITIASSNRHEKDSFLGMSYSFRPYFLTARQQEPGYYFARGVTSLKRGYYSSAPVLDENKDFLGVAVIKKNIDAFEKTYLNGSFLCLTSPDGIIFLTNRPEYLFRSLWPISVSRINELNQSRQFGSLNYAPLFSARLQNKENFYFERKFSFIITQPIVKEQWRLISLRPFAYLDTLNLLSIILTLLVILIIHFLSMIIVHYRTRQQLSQIIKLHKAELALLETEKLYREMLNTLPQIIFECDKEGKVIYANDYARRYFGISQGVSGKKWNVLEIISSRDHEKTLANIKKMLTSQCHTTDEYEFKPQHGSTFTGLAYGVPVIKNKEAVGFRGFVIDITRQKQHEENKNKISKLESIGILAGGLAHDFNNILTSISNNIHFLEIKYGSEPETGQWLSEMETAISHGKDITRQLLTFSRGGAPVKESAHIAGLLKETAEFVLSGSHCKSEYQIAAGLWPVDIDRAQISLVIRNLVLNAIQAMPGGGLILIRAENVTIPEGNKETMKAGRYVKISIRDHGQGISGSMLSKIFDPFYTTRETGMGLGLSTVHSIIQQHNGSIFVASTPGESTIFTFYLPSLAADDHPAPEQKNNIKKGTGRILIMDDDKLVLTTCKKLLEFLGYRVVAAANGSQAIREFNDAITAGDPFAVVIMDLTIKGGMGGVETLKILKNIDQHVKAIVSSGYSNNPVMANFREYGFCGIIAKPYKLSDLSMLLDKVIRST